VRILIAPDKFKGALNAREVAESIAAGLREVLPDAEIDIAPMADGGEGTAEAICDALGGSWLKCEAHDPLGREIEARYGWVDKNKIAVMEMSEAAGMRRLTRKELNPAIATSFGVGEMLLDAAQRGAKEIIIGLGGSATNDGGFGMARALGFRFLTSVSLTTGLSTWLRGKRIEVPELTGPVTELRTLERIEKPKNLSLPRIIAAVDVKNPLLGETGATQVFGPQKGLPSDQTKRFDLALARLADVIEQDFHVDHADERGAGAAGGLGFGLMSFCGATIRPGFDVVAESIGLEATMKDVDLVITGEGSLDRQTLEGKTPAGVARCARKLGKRVYAIVGRATDEAEPQKLFDGVYQNARPGMSDEQNMKHAAEFLRENARELANSL
jgi:glycerate kinase